MMMKKTKKKKMKMMMRKTMTTLVQYNPVNFFLKKVDIIEFVKSALKYTDIHLPCVGFKYWAVGGPKSHVQNFYIGFTNARRDQDKH